MREHYLTPINIPVPPHHTIVHPRCLTCRKNMVCRFMPDYLKTAALIQRILGDPQEDRKLGFYDSHCPLKGFEGFNFHNPEEIFPETTKTSDDEEAKYLDSRWRNLNIAQALYKVGEYYVIFNFFWNYEERIFEPHDCHEVYYNIPYFLDETSKILITSNLGVWRNEMEEKRRENKNYDIINTTHFSALLNCDQYEQEKGLTEEEAINRLLCKYPKGIPCGDGSFYHIATFHIEPYKVPLFQKHYDFVPYPYPVFCPAEPCRPPKVRREDCEQDI